MQQKLSYRVHFSLTFDDFGLQKKKKGRGCVLLGENLMVMSPPEMNAVLGYEPTFDNSIMQ